MNKNVITGLIVFGIGAALGGTGVYFWQKKKYESKLKDELAQAQKDSSDYIDQLIESNTELSNSLAKLMDEKKGESIQEYYDKHVANDKVETSESYDEINDIPEGKKQSKKPYYKDDEIVNIFEKYGGDMSMGSDTNKPYIIPYFEFGTVDHYKLITLRYTSDKQLVDDRTNRIVEDVDTLIGLDNLSHIHEGDDSGDCIHVRNDVRMCDYEILEDERTLEQLLQDEREFNNVDY